MYFYSCGTKNCYDYALCGYNIGRSQHHSHVAVCCYCTQYYREADRSSDNVISVFSFFSVFVCCVVLGRYTNRFIGDISLKRTAACC